MALPGSEVSALSRWTGGIDLYRTGVFTTQKTWLWCTAADVQIMRNIVHHQTDHTRTNQRRYFEYMRAHDRYAIPVSDGTDPAGWTAGLRRFVDSRYRLYQSTSFNSALRSAVTNLRKTNLPVGILVAHGNHAWVMTGFTATADPARTTRFTVTSVRVVGPLWGLQSRTYGYDMRPDKKLTPTQFRSFFTPWHYGRIRMAWEGRWVSIQPVATTSSGAVGVDRARLPRERRRSATAPEVGAPAAAVEGPAAPVAQSNTDAASGAVADRQRAPLAWRRPRRRAPVATSPSSGSRVDAWMLAAGAAISSDRGLPWATTSRPRARAGRGSRLPAPNSVRPTRPASSARLRFSSLSPSVAALRGRPWTIRSPRKVLGR